MGAPGAGKGTQGALLTARYGMPLISTGDMLRKAVAEQSVLGKRVGEFIGAGKLVPDDLIVSIIEERISREDCRGGFILDGFPRTIDQAGTLGRAVGGGLDIVVFLSVSREETIRRLAGRLTCRKCGAVYQRSEISLCPACGGDLYQREDDQKSTILHRLEVYEEHTAPLVEYYESRGKLARVDAEGDPEEVFRLVEREIAQVVAS